jgi:ATP-dependent RNA helicase RhlE
MDRLRQGTLRLLVATDVAARGIDIPGVAYVVNYDLPEVADAYVHRIGRTARAGREGEAIAFCTPEEADLIAQIQKLMKTEIPVASGKSPLAERGEGGDPRSGIRRRPGRGKGAAVKQVSEAPARRRRPRRRRAA